MGLSSSSATAPFDARKLESKVMAMCRDVAEHPEGRYHFAMGRALAERLGRPPADLDRVPSEAIESLAGVGCCFSLAALREGDTVVDLGCGSGMEPAVFREIARLIRSGRRPAIAANVTPQPLRHTFACPTTVGAACCGGAARRDDSRAMIEAAGQKVEEVEDIRPTSPSPTAPTARRGNTG